jgi:ABC-type amino acid transport substrate-binding protein
MLKPDLAPALKNYPRMTAVKTISLLSLLASVALWHTPARADNSLARVLRQNQLRVGVDASIGAPYLFWNQRTRSLDGFEWEIARELATQLKVDIRPVSSKWAEQPQQLRQQKFDVIISTREEGSLDRQLFREIPYYRTAQRLLVRSTDRHIHSFRNLIGKRVGVMPGSGGSALVDTYNKNRGNAIRVFSSQELDRMVQQLQNRQLDALILDEPLAVWTARQNSNLRVAGQPLLAIHLVVVTNQEDKSLHDAIDRALAEMRQNGKLEQILRRWQLWQTAPSLR